MLLSTQAFPNDDQHRLSYQPALDGIRALAVAAVLAYHADLPWARGGFLGVDAFFVLSGYLITSLLLAEWHAHGSIDVLGFWARRARRLLPALFLMLIGVGLYALFLAGPLELGRIRGDALATIAYVANWRPIFTGQSYFDRFSMPSPLRHTWSLGIEEQYYVIWPLLLLLLLRLRRMSPTTLLAATLLMAAASALLMGLLFQPTSDPSRVYYGTDTRAQSLLIGAALAVLLLRVGPLTDALGERVLQIAGLQCAAVVGFLWVTTSETNSLLYRGGYLFIALAVAIVIAAAVQPKTWPIGKLLSVPPLRAVGLISYGVYLWHWPVYLVLTPARVGWGLYELFALRLVVTLAIATVSYYLLELPIRRGTFRRWKVSWTLAPATAACLAIALVVVTRGAISPTAALSSDPMPQVDASANPAPVRVMVFGDSVGRSLEPGLKNVGRQSNLAVWNRAGIGCGFLPVDLALDDEMKLSKKQADMCKDWYTTWRPEVDAFRPDVVVMLFGFWDGLDHIVNGATLAAGTPEWNAYVLGELRKQFDLFTSKGARLVLLTWPYAKPPNWALLPNGAELEQDSFRRTSTLNGLYRQFAAQHPDKVSLIDLNGFACPEGKFTNLVIGGVTMREDGVHFTPQSSYVVARWLVPQILAVPAAYGP